MFEKQPCVIELMGHNRIAGWVSEQEIAGAAFIQVAVPECDSVPGFTKYYAPSAVYGITPCTEETMLLFVSRWQIKPIDVLDLRQMAKALLPRKVTEPELEDSEDFDQGELPHDYPDDEF